MVPRRSMFLLFCALPQMQWISISTLSWFPCRLSLSSYSGDRGDGFEQWLLFPFSVGTMKKAFSGFFRVFPLSTTARMCKHLYICHTQGLYTLTLDYSSSSNFWKCFSCVFLQPYGQPLSNRPRVVSNQSFEVGIFWAALIVQTRKVRHEEVTCLKSHSRQAQGPN